MTSDGRDGSGAGAWQPRFYAACAVSTAALTVMVYVLTPRTYLAGVHTGFGTAGCLALLFLAAQHARLSEARA